MSDSTALRTHAIPQLLYPYDALEPHIFMANGCVKRSAYVPGAATISISKTFERSVH